MMALASLMSMILIIMIIMTLVVNLISKKTINDREKSSPFECGFDPKTLPRLPFSLQFFLIAVIFLIFDVEITLLFPMMINLKFTNPTMISITVIFFVLILITGLYHEWKQNALDWTL